MQHPGILFMRALALLPLGWVRGLGAVSGYILYGLVASRRKVAMTNLTMCFPQMSVTQRRRMVRSNFVYFVQAWLDRSWLWHAKPDTVCQRLRLTGAVADLQGSRPTVIFAPHFYGLDAGGTALNQQLGRPMCSIYMPQHNQSVDSWLRDGRMRFGILRLFHRKDGVKSVVAALRAGELLYLLPDMNYDIRESVFVPFYGVPTATVPSLSRFARLGRAKVVPVISRLTKTGYDIEVMPAWENFPTEDAVADTALMNRRLQSYIDTMPDQYYWVHKRFKDRPPGVPPVY